MKYEAKVAQQRNEKKSCIKYAQKGLSGCTHVPRTHSTYGRHQAEKAQWLVKNIYFNILARNVTAVFDNRPSYQDEKLLINSFSSIRQKTGRVKRDI